MTTTIRAQSSNYGYPVIVSADVRPIALHFSHLQNPHVSSHLLLYLPDHFFLPSPSSFSSPSRPPSPRPFTSTSTTTSPAPWPSTTPPRDLISFLVFSAFRPLRSALRQRNPCNVTSTRHILVWPLETGARAPNYNSINQSTTVYFSACRCLPVIETFSPISVTLTPRSPLSDSSVEGLLTWDPLCSTPPPLRTFSP